MDGDDVLNEKDLEKVSKLAKLKIKQTEKASFLLKLNQVFNWIAKLEQIDVSGNSINTEDEIDIITTPERADEPCMMNTREELLSNTKFKKFNMFCVPKVVE